MPKTWSTGELVTATNFNLLPRVLYRDVLSAAAASVTIADADILGALSDWETLRLTVTGLHDGSASTLHALVVQFNADTGTNYRSTRFVVESDGTAVQQFDDERLLTGRMQASIQNWTEVVFHGHSRSDRMTLANILSGTRGEASGEFQHMNGYGQWQTTDVVTQIDVSMTGAAEFNTGTLVMLEGMMRREP